MLSKPESADRLSAPATDNDVAFQHEDIHRSISHDNILETQNTGASHAQSVSGETKDQQSSTNLDQSEAVKQMLVSQNPNPVEGSHEKISVDITPEEGPKSNVQDHTTTIEPEESAKSMSLHQLRDSSSESHHIDLHFETLKVQQNQQQTENRTISDIVSEPKVDNEDAISSEQSQQAIDQDKVLNLMSRSVAVPSASTGLFRRKQKNLATDLLRPTESSGSDEEEGSSLCDLPDEPQRKRVPQKLNVATVHGAGTYNQLTNNSLKRLNALPRLSGRDFEVEAFLGGGNVGSVYLVRKKENVLIPTARGVERFALKAMSLADLRARGKLRRLRTECEILLSCNHPFITKLHGVFADSRNVYLLLDFCRGGELAWHLRRAPGGRFPEKQALQIAAEVLSALEYLHFKGVMYRDMKTENVLVGSDGHMRLADFDLAKRSQLTTQLHQYANSSARASETVSGYKSFHAGAINTLFQCQSASLVGTAEYLAPETIRGQHSQMADFWALGILIYEMLFGFTPFYEKNATQASIMKNIREAPVVVPSTPKISKVCKDLILRLLERDVTKRIGCKSGAADIKQHPWFKKIDFAIVYAPPITLEQWRPEVTAPLYKQNETSMHENGNQTQQQDQNAIEPLEYVLRCFRRPASRGDAITVQQLIGTGFILPQRLAQTARRFAESQMNSKTLRVSQIPFNQIWEDGAGLFEAEPVRKRATHEELRKALQRQQKSAEV